MKIRRMIILLIIAFTFLGLAFVTYAGFQRAVLSKKSTTWPSVIGEIQTVELGTGKLRGVEVLYNYDISGKKYEGNTIGFGYFSGGDSAEQDALYTKLKETKSVKAYYNPANPQESTLTTGLSPVLRMSLWFGIVALSFLALLECYFLLGNPHVAERIILKTAVGGEVLREDVVADALDGFVKAHLLVRRTKPTSADDITASARRPDSTAVFGIIIAKNTTTTTTNI